MSAMRPGVLLCLLWTVTAAEDPPGRPMSYVQVTAVDSITGKPVRCDAALPGGHYTVTSPPSIWCIPAGDWQMQLTAVLYAPARCSVHLSECCTTRVYMKLVPVTLADTAISVVSGRIADAITGEPVMGAPVLLRGVSCSDYGLAHGWSDTGGLYTLQVPPGDSTIEVIASGYREASAKFSAPPNRMTELNFSLFTNSSSSDSALRVLRGVRILHLEESQYSNDSASLVRDSELKVAAWNAFRKRESLALRKLHWTVEGDAVMEYLVVKGGHATLVVNSLADGWGACRVTATPVTGIKPVWRDFDASNKQWVYSDYSDREKQGADLRLRISFSDGRSADF